MHYIAEYFYPFAAVFFVGVAGLVGWLVSQNINYEKLKEINFSDNNIIVIFPKKAFFICLAATVGYLLAISWEVWYRSETLGSLRAALGVVLFFTNIFAIAITADAYERCRKK